MSNVLTVFGKELRQYFRSSIAYFIIAAFMAGTGYFFAYDILFTGVASMAETFASMGILLLLVSPAISMRIFAAEFRAGTMELLLTLPLRPWEIVLGKFLGAATMLAAMTAATGVDVIPLYMFGTPETSTILCGYLGFLLLGLSFLAIGQMFSAFTENQIVAALVTLAVLLALWFIGNAQAFQQSGLIRGAVTYLSFSNHYREFVRGVLRTESVAFFLILITGALFINARYLEWRR
jgi:ABC-2 type transport system permease protein